MDKTRHIATDRIRCMAIVRFRLRIRVMFRVGVELE
jgi:hypothetical protein